MLGTKGMLGLQWFQNYNTNYDALYITRLTSVIFSNEVLFFLRNSLLVAFSLDASALPTSVNEDVQIRGIGEEDRMVSTRERNRR
ncbi:hypothetical protein D9756_009157 [Leucocoprinus leucothites]|uniref:Uncharacterized protein n=1 Tax=Leucocoprinus leucothites TaxID=201217 RepID=A0A8H5CYN8_9AGAR|nr:hypothetical protein D9756_009157 [Leucoagaricus leucothites]